MCRSDKTLDFSDGTNSNFHSLTVLSPPPVMAPLCNIIEFLNRFLINVIKRKIGQIATYGCSLGLYPPKRRPLRIYERKIIRRI